MSDDATDDPAEPAVVLSPHLDDAALSLGGLLGRLTGPKAVATVHGGAPDPDAPLSDWDAACGFVTPAEAYRARVAEDSRACRLLGAEQVLLPHPDGPYRRPGPFERLDAFLAGLHPRTRVYVPLGTNQPDHAAIRDQALAFLTAQPERARRVRMYADLPYTAVVAGWGTADADRELARADGHGQGYRLVDCVYGLGRAQHVLLTEPEWPRKRDAVLCYASQIGPVAGMDEVRECGELLRWPGPLRSEMVWRLGRRAARTGRDEPSGRSDIGRG